MGYQAISRSFPILIAMRFTEPKQFRDQCTQTQVTIRRRPGESETRVVVIMSVHGRRDRRVGSREDIAMEERRNDLIRVRNYGERERGVGGGGG